MSVFSRDTGLAAALTADIVHAVAALRYDSLPDTAAEFAKHCFLDWLGVTIAGSREPLSGILRAEAAADGGAGAHVLIGTGATTSMHWAALINGAASHALDFDDVVSAMGGHPSVPVFPALLALVQAQPTNGRAFITAFVAGFETECRVGSVMAPDHYAKGFHATGTVGTFGAAAACAHLAGLDATAWQTAFGLAGAQAAGLKCMFGTMAKPLHAGKAAANGLMAARLAQRGFTANQTVLEAEQGFAATQTDSYNPRALSGMHDASGITRVMFKYHAACYLTHASIEAASTLIAQRALQPEQIVSVRVLVPPGHLRVCNIQNPGTGLEGKFSLRLTVAMALTGRDTGERAFTEECVRDPVLVGLRDKVTVQAVTTLPNNYSSEIQVVLDTGEVLSAGADVSLPTKASELPRQWDKLAAKFVSLVEPVLGRHLALELVARIAQLENVDDIGEMILLTQAGT